MLRPGPRSLLALVGLAAIVAACTPPKAPSPPARPSPVLCPESSPPGPDAQAALVEPDNGPPEVVTFEATTAGQLEQKVAELDQNSTVIAVAPDQSVSVLAPGPPAPVVAPALVDPSNDPIYVKQWGFAAGKMDFPAAWNTNPIPRTRHVDGAGVRVAVVDTGVKGDHPDLDANVVPGKDFVTPSNDGRIDGHGHGTHVAGIIAAEDNAEGVVGGAPRATIVPVRVLDCQGSGSLSNVANGILWASDQSTGSGQAGVINLSLGAFGDNAVLAAAVQTALIRGVSVVAAAGNCGTGGSSCNHNEPSIPAKYSGVIAVGSSDALGAKSGFSNDNAYVAVAAPGTAIYSTYDTGGYTFLSGTSMASPHIAALAALLEDQCKLTTSASTFGSSAWPAFVQKRIIASAGAIVSGFVSHPVRLASAGAATNFDPAAGCPA